MSNEQFALKLPFPKDPKEFAIQMRHMVDFVYNCCEEGFKSSDEGKKRPAPITMLEHFFSDEGPIKCLVEEVARRWDDPKSQVACFACSVSGNWARHKEMKYAREHNILMGEVCYKPDHSHKLSFLIVGLRMQEKGIGCDCAFCRFVWHGMHTELHEDPEEPGETAVYKEEVEACVKAFNDFDDEVDADESKCAHQITGEAAQEFNWIIPHGPYQIDPTRHN